MIKSKEIRKYGVIKKFQVVLFGQRTVCMNEKLWKIILEN